MSRYDWFLTAQRAGEQARTLGRVIDEQIPKMMLRVEADIAALEASAAAIFPIDLSDAGKITGRLPFANLTQGAALSVLGVSGASPADVTSLTASLEGQVLRRDGSGVGFGALDLANANTITGNLPYANLPTGSGTWDVGSGNVLTLARGFRTTAGSVLIGHTTPVALPVPGDPTATNIIPRLLVMTNDTTGAAWMGGVRYRASTGGAGIIIGKARSNTLGTPTIVQAGDTIGSVVFAAADGVDIGTMAARIRVIVPSGTTPAANRIAGSMQLQVAAGLANDDVATVVGITSSLVAVSASEFRLRSATAILRFSSATGEKQIQTGGTTDLNVVPGGLFRSSVDFVPNTNDGAALGSASLGWADAFFASGAVLASITGDIVVASLDGDGDVELRPDGTGLAKYGVLEEIADETPTHLIRWKDVSGQEYVLFAMPVEEES